MVTAAYLLLLSRLPEGTKFDGQQSQELLKEQLGRATAAVRLAVGSKGASSSKAPEPQQESMAKPAKKSLDWDVFDSLVCAELIEPLLAAGVISSVGSDGWWHQHVVPVLEADVVYGYMGKGGKKRALTHDIGDSEDSDGKESKVLTASTDIQLPSGYLLQFAMEAMTHRWFSERTNLHLFWGFSMAMLNTQMVHPTIVWTLFKPKGPFGPLDQRHRSHLRELRRGSCSLSESLRATLL